MSKVKVAPYRVTSQTPNSDYGVTVSQVRCSSMGRPLELKQHDPIIPRDFNPENDPLRIEMDISINEPSNLYYPSEDAVATKGSRLGIALFWESRDSGRRGIGPCHYFDDGDQVRNVSLGIDFGVGELREEFDFAPKLFLESPGVIESGFTNIKGAILGNIDKKQSVVLDGNGSKYPIHEASEGPDAPLWRVQMDWDDPLADSFFRHFKIILNTDHHDYNSLKRIENPQQGEGVVPVALKEILASTLFGMMVKLKDSTDDWSAIMEGKSEPKSVGQLAWVYKEHESWNLASPSELLQDIRKTVESI